MGPLTLTISRWAAWAPGLETADAWQAWAHSDAPTVPVGPETPPLAEVPAMTRRRIERQGRLAFQVAAWCQGEDSAMPAIFASRHGDPARSQDLLDTLARSEALSPTSFGLSVHNAIGAQYSIVRKDTSNFTSLAAGRNTVESAFVEAAALLHEGNREVLVVVYDAALPEAYRGHLDEPVADFAWAVRVAPGDGSSAQFSLTLTAEALGSTSSPLPHALDVARFIIGRRPSLTLEVPGGTWVWSHAA